MSLRLRAAALWMPERSMLRMVERVDGATTAALDDLIRGCGARPPLLASGTGGGIGGLEAARATMASGHDARVRALVEAVGRDRAVELGRQALHQVGVALGTEAREGLSVGDGPRELEMAARVLYGALGIHFELERRDDGTMLMRVDRCALSHHYSEEACLVLSAADEGVVAGLSPGSSMLFDQRMTSGCGTCVARIREAAG